MTPEGTGADGLPRTRFRRSEDEHDAAVRNTERQLQRLIGTSPQMKRVKEQIRRVAATRIPVLLLGATGTGKGLAAEVIHAVSRRSGDFEAVNGATLSETLNGSELFGHRRGAFTGAVRDSSGAVERAHRGTLFLDEVADLPMRVQPMLLKVLDNGWYRPLGGEKQRRSDFRLITATNRSIRALISDGRFREDLYGRINTCEIRMPDLAERGADVILIAESLLPEISTRYDLRRVVLSPGARGVLLECPWPRNIRDLGSVLLRAVLAAEGDVISGLDMYSAVSDCQGNDRPAVAGGILSLREAEDNARRRSIARALIACDGNKSAAARMLGVSPRHLYRLRKRLELE